jgi:hypothetical protein
VIPGLEGFTNTEIAWDRTRPGTLFVGGENMILQAVLLKSTDGGLTWRNTLDIDFHGDNAIDAIAIDPNNPDRMIAGTEGFILRSTDAGERWTVATEPGRYYMYGATWSNTEPETIFVTGGNSAPNSGGIFLSADNGATWSTIDTNRWRTVQRAIVSPTMPGALLFTTGTVAGQSDNGMPGGVYLVIAETASVPPGSSSAVVWQSERSVHIRNIEGHGPLRWNLVDLRGISSGSGTVGAGEEHTIRLDALPSGVHMLRYSDAAGVSTLKVVVVE